MDSSQQKLLDQLPALQTDDSRFPKCKLCEGDTAIFDCVDFNKYCSSDPYWFGLSGISVPYYRCGRCNFIFTDFIDEWNADEVTKYIYNADYIKVDPEYLGVRAIRSALVLARQFAGCEHLRILDYGSGSGVFAEEMRKRGFHHVEGYDPFSSPAEPVGLFDLITCFEVIEHSPKPLRTVEEMAGKLSSGGVIIIGQTLQPGNIDEIGGRWWYLAPRNGHVSFFAEETFITLANRANLTYHRGPGFYVLSRDKLSRPIANVVAKTDNAVHLHTLAAPGPDLGAPGWHGIEQRGSRMFRWSMISELAWPEIELHSGINMIQIPFLMSICDDFAERCSVAVDGKKLATRIERRRVIGEIAVSRPRMCRVALITPPPLSPHDLRGTPDTRKLGLAVSCW